jgi:hypothetical protein
VAVSDINIDLTSPIVSLPTLLVVNATSPLGANTSYSASVTDALDPSPILVCAPASGTVFPIGDTAVNCRGEDRAGNLTSAVFSVHVNGAVEQLNALWVGIINDSRLPANVKSTLATRVQEALSRFDPSDPKDRKLACASMSLFVALVRAHSNRSIPKPRADAYIADAIRIRAVLGCQ